MPVRQQVSIKQMGRMARSRRRKVGGLRLTPAFQINLRTCTMPFFADASLMGRLLHLVEARFAVYLSSLRVGTLLVLLCVLCQ